MLKGLQNKTQAGLKRQRMYKCCQLQSSHDCSVNIYAVGVVVFCFKFELLRAQPKLQALVYDTLPSATAIFSYAIGSRKLSANEQFFCLLMLQTSRIISDVCFITDHIATPAQIKPQSFESRQNSSFFYPGWMRLMFMCVLGR